MESKKSVKNHALLPEFLERQTIADMLPGEYMTARCAALRVTKGRKTWLDPQLEVYDDLHEDHPLLVERTEEGYIVDASYVGTYRWPEHEDLETISSQYGVGEEEWIVPIDFLPRLPSA